MPLPAKGAVAPMPSRTAGLFASRGAGRAAGAACVRKGGFLALCRRSLSRPARTARVQPRTAGSQPHRPIPAASKSRVYQSRRVAAASTASGATRSRAGPAPPLRRAGGGIARFAASTTSEQRTGCHAWIVFSQADLMRSQPSGGGWMVTTHRADRWSRRRRARAAIHCFDIQGFFSASTASTARLLGPDAAHGPARRRPQPYPPMRGRASSFGAVLASLTPRCEMRAGSFRALWQTLPARMIAAASRRAVRAHA